MEEFFDKNTNISVIKRDGKKVDFNGAKIALAIKKSFDSVILEDGENHKYNQNDANKIYNLVIFEIEKMQTDKIKIETIQDLIEEQLKINGYEDVYHSFSIYRENRKKSREAFFSEKKQHKFLKALENLGLKSSKEDDIRYENTNITTAMETIIQYGSTISREFAKSYLMKPKFAEAHDSGDIYIHDLDFIPTGTTSCCQINLSELFEDGFLAGNAFLREPNDISSYSALTSICIQLNQNDQHGPQSISALDYYLAPGVLKTFKKVFKQIVYDYLEYTNFINFIAINGIVREIDKLESINFDITIFNKYCRNSDELERLFRICYDKALEKTNNATYQAMEALIHNLNTIHTTKAYEAPFACVNFGTDTSYEGRMITKNFLEVLDVGLGRNQTPLSPISIFKIKEGINYNPTDINYDLFKLACKVSAKRFFPNFSFIDSSFNKLYYRENDFNTEVSYMGDSIRILENTVDNNKSISSKRGILSLTTINLPRLGIKHGIISNEQYSLEAFFEELEEKLNLVKDQLLERYEIQCNKKVTNFPFLMGQNIWIDSEKLKSTDKLRKVLKHGNLSIGFIGLSECLKFLIGKHHGEDNEAQKIGLKIISFMRKKCDEYSKKYNLNFTLIASSNEDVCKKFLSLDKAIFGKILGIPDDDYYTTSFHISSSYNISIDKKIALEGPYHALTNGGHISSIELPNNSNIDDFEKFIRVMKSADFGYCSINYKKV